MNKITLTIILFLKLTSAVSQSSYAEFMAKYANFRYRFNGDAIQKDNEPWGGESGFIVIGEGAGKSLPFRTRLMMLGNDDYRLQSDDVDDTRRGNNFEDCSYQGIHVQQRNYPNGVNPNHYDPTRNYLYHGFMTTGDGILPDVGYYLGLLCTEWKLRKRNGMDLSAIESELEFAFKAIERLDRAGEERYWSAHRTSPANVPGVLNGLLWRDDVPWDFALPRVDDGIYHFGFPEDNFGTNFNIVNSIYSCIDWQDDPRMYCGGCESMNRAKYKPWAEEKLMSQDQILKMYIGLALAAKLLDHDAVSSTGREFKTWAADIALRITSYIRSGGNHIQCNNDPTSGYWKIEDPEGDLVCPGGDLVTYCWALAKATNRIHQWAYGTSYIAQNTYSNTIGSVVWSAESALYDARMILTTGRLALNANNDEMYAIMRITSGFNRHLNSRRVIGSMAKRQDKPEWDLFWAVLNDKIPFQTKNYYKGVISQLDCTNPRNSQFFHPRPPRWKDNRENALQWMLLINLFGLVEEFPLYTGSLSLLEENSPKMYDLALGEEVGYADLKNRTVRNTFPDQSVAPTMGRYNSSSTDVLNMYAAESLVLLNLLESDAHVNFTAPHISLEPGFEATLGSVTDIRNGRMECANQLVVNLDNNHELFAAKTDVEETDTVLVSYEPDELTQEEIEDNEEFRKLIEGFSDTTVNRHPMFVLYPNPARENANADILLFEENTNCRISILDIHGHLVRSFPIYELRIGINQISIDISDVMPGMYAVIFNSDQETVQSRLIIY